MPESASLPTGIAAGRLDQARRPGPEHERLNAIIGRWINEGHTINPDGSPGLKILASDVYEWAPGGFFVVHSAYGRMGDFGGGGIEIIGYDAASQTYPVHFFDSQGNATRHEIVMQDDRTWIWQGEHTRCTGIFSDDGRIQTAHHERTDDGVHWVPSMDVTLRKVD
jgi:Protein of unknown function (DUF1579)